MFVELGLKRSARGDGRLRPTPQKNLSWKTWGGARGLILLSISARLMLQKMRRLAWPGAAPPRPRHSLRGSPIRGCAVGRRRRTPRQLAVSRRERHQRRPGPPREWPLRRRRGGQAALSGCRCGRGRRRGYRRDDSRSYVVGSSRAHRHGARPPGNSRHRHCRLLPLSCT